MRFLEASLQEKLQTIFARSLALVNKGLATTLFMSGSERVQANPRLQRSSNTRAA